MRAVLFDMDGVLFDSERVGRDVMMAAMAELGGDTSVVTFEMMLGINAAACNELLWRHFGADFPAEELHRRFYERMCAIAQSGMPQKDGATECLTELKRRGYKLALASSSHREIIDEYFAHSSLGGLMDAVVSGPEVRLSKPAPDIYLLAAERLDVPACDCVGVEDSRAGVESVRRAGAACVMVPDMLPYGPDFAPFVDAVLPSLRLLPAWLEQQKRKPEVRI